MSDTKAVQTPAVEADAGQVPNPTLQHVLDRYREMFNDEPSDHDLTAINLALPRIAAGEPFCWSQQGQWRVLSFDRNEAPSTDQSEQGMDDGCAATDGVNKVARTHAHVRIVLPRPWMQRFVDALRDTPVVGMACAVAGISRVSAYKWREQDEDFRREWDAALEDGWDTVEDVALRMARGGSERLVEFLLRGNKAKTYRETHDVNVTHDIGPNMAGVLANVRMSRDAILGGQSVRELPVTDVKVLSVNDAAKDGESCAGRKEA